MAILHRVTTNRYVSISTRHSIGRVPSSGLFIDDPSVSALHAVIEWLPPGVWSFRDVGSRNGTMVNGQRVAANHAVVLRAGHELRFSASTDVWRMVDDGPPALASVSPGGDLRIARSEFLILPDDDSPEVTIVCRGGEWQSEEAFGRGPARIIRDGETVTAGGVPWTILVPQLLPDTKRLAQSSAVGDLHLTFRVSRDEEHVTIEVNAIGVSSVLAHRSHHYLLVTLARTRLSDSLRSTLPPAEHGWIEREQLERMLRMPTEQLNLQVFRARKQFAELGIDGAAGIVERRTGSSQLRIGAAAIRVERN
jgi:hypothetical protein